MSSFRIWKSGAFILALIALMLGLAFVLSALMGGILVLVAGAIFGTDRIEAHANYFIVAMFLFWGPLVVGMIHNGGSFDLTGEPEPE